MSDRLTRERLDYEAEIARLREENRMMREALDGAVVAMEAWAMALGKDPCNNDNYCRAKDTLAKLKEEVWN